MARSFAVRMICQALRDETMQATIAVIHARLLEVGYAFIFLDDPITTYGDH